MTFSASWRQTREVSPATFASTKKRETHLQEANEAKNQKEAEPRNGEEKPPSSHFQAPDAAYSPAFSALEPRSLSKVGLPPLEIERALASLQGHRENTVKKRPQKKQPRGGQDRDRKKEERMWQAVRQGGRGRDTEHQALCCSSDTSR